MGILGDAIGGAVDTVIDSAGHAIDELITSDEERLILKNKLIEIGNANQVDMAELEVQHEKEITKRWDADSKSSDWLTRNVRPMTLIFFVLAFAGISVTDSITTLPFTMGDEYISTYKMILTTIVVAYFGSRGIEKVTATMNGHKVHGISEQLDEDLNLY